MYHRVDTEANLSNVWGDPNVSIQVTQERFKVAVRAITELVVRYKDRLANESFQKLDTDLLARLHNCKVLQYP